ncbi:MAG TPA: hypothetical protein VGL81_07555 [Polyangiaceae bacterium]
MPDVTQRTVIEETLIEIDERLRTSLPSPAVRELRVRHGSLNRVVRGWLHVPPHDAQISAMLECVLELRGQVARACAPAFSGEPSAPARRSTRPAPRSAANARASATQARTTRPPPRRDASMRTTRPPPVARSSDVPPSVPPSSRRG